MLHILPPALEIEAVEEGDVDALHRMIDFYCYDYAEFDGADLLPSGSYEYIDARKYYERNNTYPYVFKMNGEYAGFALIQRVTDETGTFWYLEDYFIMRKFRRYGIGKQAAVRIFDRLEGEWEVRQDASNEPAQKFWKKVIGAYTNNHYRSIQRRRWNGPIQRFYSQSPKDDERRYG